MISCLLFIPDPLADEPSGVPRVLVLAMFLIATVLSGWVMFNTQRAMIWMASRGPERWPGRATATRLAKKPVWVWLYRIDSAIVFAGCVLMLATHLLNEFRY